MMKMAAASSLNEMNLEKRLMNVTNTQESIQTLSLWCLHHKAHYAKIVEIWMNVFTKAKVTHQLALFYLANDVIQNSKRKGFVQFSEAWLPIIKSAMPMVKVDKIKLQIDRILSIWEERNVFDTQSIMELRSICSNFKDVPSSDPIFIADFKPQKLADKMKKFKKLEADVEMKHKQFTSLKLDVCSTETLKQLKDKAHGTKFTKEFDDATTKLDEFVQMLQRRAKERKALIELLEESESFYDTQRKEAKIVANAYKNFGSRVKNLQIKLEGMLPNLSSPMPSPSIDAPSPVDSPAGSPNANQNKDNIEAVDMEMSDEDCTLSSSNKNEIDNNDAISPSSAPSPDGSPVGLSASPNLLSDSTNSNAKVHGTKVSAATSLLNSIASSATAKSTASSLDIRLSNLMQSIPNFSASFFGSSQLEGTKSAVGTSNKPGPRFTDVLTRNEGGGTPLKDEESGMGSATPLQDENRESNLHFKPEGQAPNIISNLLQKLSSSTMLQPNQGQARVGPSYRDDTMSGQSKLSWLPKKESVSNSDKAAIGALQPPPQFVNFMPPPIARVSNPFYSEGLNFSPLRSPVKSSSSNGMQSSLPADKSAFPSLITEKVGRRNSNIVQLTPSPNTSPHIGLGHLSDWNIGGVPENLGEPDLDAIKVPPVTSDVSDFTTAAGFRPSLLNLPKKPTITINLRNTKAPGTGREPNNGNANNFSENECTPSMHITSLNSSNLRTIIPLNADNNGVHEPQKKHDHSYQGHIPSETRPTYSKIEILESHRGESHDPWASVAADQVRDCVQFPVPNNSSPVRPGWHQMLVPPLRNMRPRFPGQFGNGRGFVGIRSRGVAPRRDWRAPFGPPKRPLLSPGGHPARWNYYPQEF